MATNEELVKRGYSIAQIDAIRKAETQDTLTTGAIVSSGAMIGLYLGGAIGGVLGGLGGAIVNYVRKKVV